MRQIGPQLETILAAFPPLYPDLFSLFLVLFLLVLEETHLLSLFLSFFVFNVLTKKKKKGWERPIENKKEKKKKAQKKRGKE
jgi:cytochrome bd-type quinol oxidase subunit 2